MSLIIWGSIIAMVGGAILAVARIVHFVHTNRSANSGPKDIGFPIEGGYRVVIRMTPDGHFAVAVDTRYAPVDLQYESTDGGKTWQDMYPVGTFVNKGIREGVISVLESKFGSIKVLPYGQSVPLEKVELAPVVQKMAA